MSSFEENTFSVHERRSGGRRVARGKVDPQEYPEHRLVGRHQQRGRNPADPLRLAQVFDLQDARVLEDVQIVEFCSQSALRGSFRVISVQGGQTEIYSEVF